MRARASPGTATTVGRRPGSPGLGELALVACGLVAGLLLAEGFYRVRLVTGLPGHFGQPARRQGPAVVFDRSPWSFDALQGFRYPPGLEYHVTSIEAGRVVGCLTLSVNARGSHGPAGRDPAEASRRLVFFGDSFTAAAREGTTYPARLAELLEARLGGSVSIANLARDGTGILQMVDFAAASDLSSADLVVLAFITDDLSRARIWRATVDVQGRSRILLTTTPDPQPDPRAARDVAMLDPRATPAWCAEARRSGRGDALAEELERRFEELRAENQPVRADVFSRRRSFLWSRLSTGDPFSGWQTAKPPINPRITAEDFRQDERFVAASRRLTALGKRLRLVHLPSAREVRAGRMLLETRQDQRLYASLEAALGQPVHSLVTELAQRPVEGLFLPPPDGHPSRAGLEAMAESLATWLQEQLAPRRVD